MTEVSESPAYSTYAEWGQNFFEHAVTKERILAALSGLAGDTFDFGPIGVGPGRIAKVTARGQIGEASATRLPGDEVRFDLAIPVELNLVLDLAVDQHRFHATVVVHLKLTARAAAPLRVVIDIERPTKKDIDVALQAEGLRASLVQYAAGIDGEIGRFVAKYVSREIDKPHIRRARDIDVAARIDSAWATPRR